MRFKNTPILPKGIQVYDPEEDRDDEREGMVEDKDKTQLLYLSSFRGR